MPPAPGSTLKEGGSWFVSRKPVIAGDLQGAALLLNPGPPPRVATVEGTHWGHLQEPSPCKGSPGVNITAGTSGP